MFEATSMLFIWVETPLHAGTGQVLGAVDLPIQRERTTGYPIVQASGIKGPLRAAAEGRIPDVEWLAIFGPKVGGAEGQDYAGALSTGDARVLLFPVRSLAGVFAWVTSVDALARFQRGMAMLDLDPGWRLPPQPGSNDAWVGGNALAAGDHVVLDEFSFAPRHEHSEQVRAIGDWLAGNALPQGDEYSYWRNALPDKLCVLPEDDFRSFALYGTEIQTHVRLDPERKTVQTRALWTTESLPVDTLLYAPLMATKARAGGVQLDGRAVLQRIAGMNLKRAQLGGNETTGQGVVALRIVGGGGQ